jgi:hypothetical protein
MAGRLSKEKEVGKSRSKLPMSECLDGFAVLNSGCRFAIGIGSRYRD